MSQENVVRYRVPPLRRRTRRTPLERLGLRFPEINRWFLAAVLRLPTSSRLRREILARALRDSADAFARRDYDAFMLGWDPKIVFDTGDAFPEQSVLHGLKEARRYVAMFEDAWEDYRIEPQGVVDFGDRYILFARHTAHGRHSGAEVDHRVGLVGIFGGGSIVSLVLHWSPARVQALEAAALAK